jgi:hypothetical protein
MTGEPRNNAAKTPRRASGRPFQKGNPGRPKGAFARTGAPFGVTTEMVITPGAEAAGLVTTSSVSVTETTLKAAESPNRVSAGSLAVLRPAPSIVHFPVNS